jgi:hypothetical protein
MISVDNLAGSAVEIVTEIRRWGAKFAKLATPHGSAKPTVYL